MNLAISVEHHFVRTPDGAVWTQTSHARSFWVRYLDVFDRVRVIARVGAAAAPPPAWIRADGDGISFHGVPEYQGPWQYAARARQVRESVRSALTAGEAVIARVPSTIGSVLLGEIYKRGYPHGLEVLGDPYDFYLRGSLNHPLRPFLLRWVPRQLRRQCAMSPATCYVTEYALQRRYPPRAYSMGVSDVELPFGAFARGPRRIDAAAPSSPLTVISVGTMAHLYKSQDVLIRATALCHQRGMAAGLVLIGDGKCRAALARLTRDLGIADRVAFRGSVTAGEPVRRELDAADVFVLPSRQEGLPRAMVEAMARGLPCIGSTVGGIPELLAEEDLVPHSDAGALAQKLLEVLGDPARRTRMSARNFARAQDYRDDVLRARRNEFYRYVEQKTRTFVETSPRAKRHSA